MTQIVLASQSRQREMLLRQIGIEPIVSPVNINEELYFIEQNNYATALKDLGMAKAKAASAFYKGNILLGADTVILLKDTVYPKPKNLTDARRTLRELSGKTHKVITGIGVINNETGEKRAAYEESEVTFKRLSDNEIEWYIRTGEPLGKAGAYAIQGQGAIFVKQLSGSYSNVVGLPLYLTAETLKAVGYAF